MRFPIRPLATLLLATSATLFAQQPAEKATSGTNKRKSPDVTEPADPAVLALADGKIRHNPATGFDEAYLPIVFFSSHASNLLQLKNGDILDTWFSGRWEGSSDVGIVVSRLPKGSSQWEKTIVVDHQEGFSFQNPVLFQSPDGVVHIYHTTQAAHEGEANAHVLESDSKDGGKTWSPPHMVFDQPGAFSRHPLLILDDGTWMFPISVVNSRGIGGAAALGNYSAIELSHDSGKTWKDCKVEGSTSLVQPTVVRSADGSFIAFFRDRRAQWIYESTSKDGCTWEKPYQTVLPNNNASVQAFRLHDGHLVIIFDNLQGKGPRRPVSVALSEDEGKTWKYVRDLEVGRPEILNDNVRGAGREEYSYPSIMQAADGTIYASFTFRRETIKVVSFQEDWLKHGGTVGMYQPPASTK